MRSLPIYSAHSLDTIPNFIPHLTFLLLHMATSAELINPSVTRLGWIGTGLMGRSMCAHLINAGYTLTVFNRTLSKAQPLVDMGARLAQTPHDLAAQSDIVFSIVAYPSDVSLVLLDPTTGALSGLRPGGILVDMTTSEPSLAVEISAAASSKNCSLIDAPVSGGVRGAKNGTLAIFAGGDEAVVNRPVHELANQITITSTMVGLVEGIVYSHKAGMNVASFLDAISTGAAGSKSLDLHGSRILKRDFEPGFFVNHFVKDLGIC
ncbi:putative 3-hydroxyisobutyrate dehydrogenase-like 1 [Hibiscus syriacus]|uniref:3-hydroxyisobutyrate dehydrogenase-like 1 n=1 Tax=Hibiscus syriacus TaxID=106335 RepID=A0A6A2Z926_HIBSY|nr:putative 3-hydroxyisobutyrate dehydrogenase-like 1 [Hibiscus syriacus]